MPPYIPPARRRMKARQAKKSKVMKKVGKKGAYKKRVKNQMVMRRAPIVETKQRVHSDVAEINGYPAGSVEVVNQVNPLNWRLLPVQTAFTNIALRSWTRNVHGFQENHVVGNNIFSKYLNFKIQFRFPDSQRKVKLPSLKTPGTYVDVPNKMIERPTKLYLICGWITQPMNYPLNSDVSPSLPAQADADGDAIANYITQQLKPYFDDDEDKLQFRPKETTNIKIEKYVRIKPNLNTAIGTQATPYQQWSNNLGENVNAIEPNGSIPDVHRSHSWKTMRKLPLTEGKEVATYSVDKQNLFPNNSWVPFAVVYNPDYESQLANILIEDGEVSQVQNIQFRYNDAHYFTDS